MDSLHSAPRGAEAPSRPEVPAPKPVPIVVNDLAEEDSDAAGDGWPPFPHPVADAVWTVARTPDA